MRLTLLCAAATASSRTGGFPAPGEPLDDGGLRNARSVRLRGPRPDIVVSSPARAAIETAQALALDATIDPLVADLDFGDWSGRSLADLHPAAPDALARWIADPTQAPPGGETMAALSRRIAVVVDRLAGAAGSAIVVTHAAPIRAALAHALSLPLASVMHFDIAPLACVVLSHRGRWRLRELGQPAG